MTKKYEKIWYDWTWETSYSCSDKGRTWVGWKHLDVDMTVLACSEQFILCTIKHMVATISSSQPYMVCILLIQGNVCGIVSYI